MRTTYSPTFTLREPTRRYIRTRSRRALLGTETLIRRPRRCTSRSDRRVRIRRLSTDGAARLVPLGAGVAGLAGPEFTGPAGLVFRCSSSAGTASHAGPVKFG